ncbi:Crp/Fnr family transcriptional regulator [Balneolaceae bacterium YR4-1]|uniref:Crp/Fnr family transcriptional regulator n=1 Tax=Halalkalibaculum roseum TaxID=2709311 RepID=A0A6M1SZI1_9BACT|nr:Crp/Fnr family transcriptional regulator [Halalkalibaculum roseum]
MKEKLRKEIEEIEALTDEEFTYITSHFKERRFKKNQFVVQEGMPVPYDFFVVKGLLKAYVIDDKGKEHILQFAMENWWISDYQAHFSEKPASINIDCIEDCEMLALSLENRRKICREFHKMDRFFSIKFNLGYIRLQQRILSLLRENAEERYRNLLEKQPDLIQRVPKKYLAGFLGLSRETLSRLDLSPK